MCAHLQDVISTTFHQNVNGDGILLHLIQHGRNGLCVEYVVENVKLYSVNDLLIILPLLTAFFLDTVLENRSLGYGILFLITLYYCLSKLLWKVRKECILVVAYIGIQVKVVYASGQHSTHFIPWSSIKDVIIQECIVKQKVLYILTVLVESKRYNVHTKLIPLLTETAPRLPGIESIYCNIQNIIKRSGH